MIIVVQIPLIYEFINDIESAIDSNLTDDEKFDRLKKIIEKYGQFYSKKIFFGGIIIKPSECNKDQSNYNHTFLFLYILSEINFS